MDLALGKNAGFQEVSGPATFTAAIGMPSSLTKVGPQPSDFSSGMKVQKNPNWCDPIQAPNWRGIL